MTERKDGSRAEPLSRPERYNQIRTASARPPSVTGASGPGLQKPPGSAASVSPAPQQATTATSGSGQATQYPPPPSTSKLDINGVPTYNGEPITKIGMESELLPADKPWRKPGADVTDYFNYGFDEFTWTAYCAKQEGLREEFSPQKMMEQMMMMSGMGMGMMPGMDGMDPTAIAGMMGATPGMDMMAAAAAGADPSMFMGAGGQGFPVPTGPGQGQDPGFGMGRGQMYVGLYSPMASGINTRKQATAGARGCANGSVWGL